MKEKGDKKEPILVVGNDKLAFSITVCLVQAGHPVTLYTEKEEEALTCLTTHFTDMGQWPSDLLTQSGFTILDHLDHAVDCGLAIAVTNENLSEKRLVVRQLEKVLSREAVIAINTESIPLSAIQQDTFHPERILGTNWVEPAHTTYFLEIISNQTTPKSLVEHFSSVARQFWQKDPYVLYKDCGIRARLMGAMIREAFYLLENGYVSVEDIDRACRNDAGYYLPFAGNCRYMDLMGTYIYGVVMQDLNPELSKDRHIPAFFQEIMQQGRRGMENNKGFYTYQDGEVERWDEVFRKFSYQIQEIIAKYPFHYKEEAAMVEHKSTSHS